MTPRPGSGVGHVAHGSLCTITRPAGTGHHWASQLHGMQATRGSGSVEALGVAFPSRKHQFLPVEGGWRAFRAQLWGYVMTGQPGQGRGPRASRPQGAVSIVACGGPFPSPLGPYAELVNNTQGP